jgi:hypothetical protein
MTALRAQGADGRTLSRPQGVRHLCAQLRESGKAMLPPHHLHDQRCLRSLPEVAQVLGVTRSAVNLMVHDGRLAASRHGPGWYVCIDVLERFCETYEPAPSAGRKLGRRGGGPDMVETVHELLCDWGEARVDELSEVVQRDPGNVRKYLAILHQRGLARRTTSATWEPTNAAPGIVS